MRSWLIYTAARLGLFAGAFGVVYLFGARSWVAIFLAWVISGLASYVLLSKWRDQLSRQIVDRVQERKGAGVGDRLEDGASREDHLQEEQEESEEPETPAESNTEEKSSTGDTPPQGVEDGASPAKDT